MRYRLKRISQLFKKRKIFCLIMRKSWVDIQMLENDTKRNFIRIKTGLIIKTRIDKIDKSAFTIILVWMPLSVRSVKEIASRRDF